MADYSTMNEESFISRHNVDFVNWFKRRSSFGKVVLFLTSAIILAFCVILIGLLVDRRSDYVKLDKCLWQEEKPMSRMKVHQNVEAQKNIKSIVLEHINRDIIKDHLKNLTSTYHVAGTPENLKVMNYIANAWRSYGLDVEVEEYNVLLSYPDYKQPNTLEVVLSDGKSVPISKGLSTPLGPAEALSQQHDDRAKLWWNAYSKNGVVQGSIIYGNFCSSDDLDYVLRTLNATDFSKGIVLCRYGGAWRGAKVFEAERRQAAGVILYTDPAEYGTREGLHPFPDSIYMPPTGAQRGSTMQTDGDPETPELPSKNYTFRFYNESELRKAFVLPNVPVTPVSYGVAQKIFENMKQGGIPAPESSKGGLNVTYYLSTSTVFKLTVNAKTERRLIRNVFGYIYGEEEPDRLILLSNHVDAWTYGAQDPNSGTAINLALSQAFMTTVNTTKWRPRRTLVFCAWDAEEYGLVGSTEWVQQKRRLLEERAVALINVDTAIKANETLGVKAVPLMYRAVLEATKLVDNPNEQERQRGRSTVYHSWLANSHKPLLPHQPDVPYMNIPAGGSDFKPFLQYTGVPSTDLFYTRPKAHNTYPMYHTMYEIDWTVEHLLDSEFRTSQALGKVWAAMVVHFSDSLVVPFNVSDYGLMLDTYVTRLIGDLNETSGIEKLVDNHDVVFESLHDAVNRFQAHANQFQQQVDEANSGSQVTLGSVQRLNDRLLGVERAFLTPRGLPNRPGQRHVLFANSVKNAYGSTMVAGVRDSLADCQSRPQDNEARKILNVQLSVLQYAVESAIDTLKLGSPV